MSLDNPPILSDAQGAEARSRSDWLDSIGRKYSAALHRFFLRRSRTLHEEAEDLTQEVFARLSRRSEQAPITQVEGYIFQTASNVLKDRFRRRAVRHEELHDLYVEDDHAIEDFSCERVLIGRQEVEIVLASLQSLPVRVQEAFVLHRLEHLTYPAIAARLGVSVSSIEKYIMQALKQITISRREAE